MTRLSAAVLWFRIRVLMLGWRQDRGSPVPLELKWSVLADMLPSDASISRMYSGFGAPKA
ncbi:hypothetical protein ACSVHC_00805 [Arthrobacter sp. KNU-44]|uniref:hypothetical protein n=1 Tax=Arthrobacter sp. KNU-44 TaxID=3450744 RepID=UPI003F41DEA9